MHWQWTSRYSARQRYSSAVILAIGAASLLVQACGGTEEHPSPMLPSAGSSSGGAKASNGGNAGAGAGTSAGAGASGLGGAGTAGEGGEGADSQQAGADSGGSSPGSGGAPAAGGETSAQGGTASAAGDDGSGGADCIPRSEACTPGANSCCSNAACYDSGNGNAFCATRCTENRECNSSEPGCCAPLGEDGAGVCVPIEFC
jgi:hypothetical protein